eukprot:sb/3465973/
MDPVTDSGYSAGAQILIGIILYLVSIVGTVGNLSLIIALRKNRKLKNSSNFLTISLAASDILIAGIAMPISGYAALNINGTGVSDGTGGAQVYNYTAQCLPADQSVPSLHILLQSDPDLTALGQGKGLLIYTSSKISTWTLCCMAVERYVAVIHPLTYNRWITQRRILTVTAIIWIISPLVELPQVLGWFPFVYYHNAFGCLSPSFHHMGYQHPGFIAFSICKKNSLFRSRNWLSANQGSVYPDSVGSCYRDALIIGSIHVSQRISKNQVCSLSPGYCYHMIMVVSFKSKQSDNIFRKNFNTPKKEDPQIRGALGRRLTAHESLAGILTKTSEKYQCYKKSFIWFVIIISYTICWTPVSGNY